MNIQGTNAHKGFIFPIVLNASLQARVLSNLKAIIKETNWNRPSSLSPDKRCFFSYDPRHGMITASGEQTKNKVLEDRENVRVLVLKISSVSKQFFCYPLWIGEIPFEVNEAVGILNLSNNELEWEYHRKPLLPTGITSKPTVEAKL